MTAPALPRGGSAWTYDFSPGRVDQIRRHDAAAAPARRFAYLFPYAGSVEVDAVHRRVQVSYKPDTVAAYVQALGPGIRMLPIVDGRQDQGEFNGWSATEYAAAADAVADRLLADHNAAGVQIDIEPFHPDHIPFYAALGARLRKAGKLTTGFMGPGRPPAVLEAMYRACDVVVLSGYDFGLETPAAYTAALDAALGRCHAVAVSVGGHSMVGVPAGASWGEHEYHGTLENGRCTRKDSGFTQTAWLAAALAAYAKHEHDATMVGLAFWNLTDQPAGPRPDCLRGDQPDYISDGAWELLR